MSKEEKLKLIQFTSFACVIHCVITPILILVAPFLGHLFENIIVEFGLLILSIICGIFIVYNGYGMHRKKYCIILFSFGALLWILHSLFEIKDIFDAKIYFTIGTFIVLISYYFNHRLIKSCGNKS